MWGFFFFYRLSLKLVLDKMMWSELYWLTCWGSKINWLQEGIDIPPSKQKFELILQRHRFIFVLVLFVRDHELPELFQWQPPWTTEANKLQLATSPYFVPPVLPDDERKLCGINFWPFLKNYNLIIMNKKGLQS